VIFALLIAQAEVLATIVDPCVEAAVDRAAVGAALAIELAPTLVRIESSTTAHRVLVIDCGPGAIGLTIEAATTRVALEGLAIEDRARVIALAAAELERLPGGPRLASTASIASRAVEVTETRTARPPELSPWRLSLRSDLRKLVGDHGGTFGLTILGERRPAPLGLLIGGSFFGVDSGDKTRLALEAEIGFDFVIAEIGPASIGAEVILGAGLAGILDGKADAFALASAKPLVRWAIADDLDLLTSVGLAWVPTDSWLLQGTVGAAWGL
jgi:hypothetical protein